MSLQLEHADALDLAPVDIDMVTTLYLGPGGLDRYMELVGDRRNPLIKYRDGSLTLVSPSKSHERTAERIDGLIKEVCDVFGIDYLATASTLFRRPGTDHGIEADKSYYIEHEGVVRGLAEEIDLIVYPPPDLAVEAVVTHGLTRALAIYQELGVPEVWVYRPRRRVLEFLLLDDQAKYHAAPNSRAFAILTPSDVVPWVESTVDESDMAWRSRLRPWVAAELAPRRV